MQGCNRNGPKYIHQAVPNRIIVVPAYTLHCPGCHTGFAAFKPLADFVVSKPKTCHFRRSVLPNRVYPKPSHGRTRQAHDDAAAMPSRRGTSPSFASVFHGEWIALPGRNLTAQARSTESLSGPVYALPSVSTKEASDFRRLKKNQRHRWLRTLCLFRCAGALSISLTELRKHSWRGPTNGPSKLQTRAGPTCQ